MNRMWNAKNPYQGNYKKVLCVCSAGLLRSPSAAVVLSQEPFNYNTRAVGIDKGHALIPIEPVHIEWADEVVIMESWMGQEVEAVAEKYDVDCPPTVCLNLPDEFEYRNPELMKMIEEKYNENS